MKKRILAGVCAISLCAGILAGCAGSGSEPTSTPTQGSSEAVTDANKAAEFVTFEATAGEAIKVVITEWNSTGWAGFAEMDYTTTEAPEEEELAGDVNLDGAVNISDVTELLKVLAGN